MGFRAEDLGFVALRVRPHRSEGEITRKPLANEYLLHPQTLFLLSDPFINPESNLIEAISCFTQPPKLLIHWIGKAIA